MDDATINKEPVAAQPRPEIKKFLIKCDHCDFKLWSDGSEESTAELRAVESCQNCGGPKKYKCPKCGFVAKSRRYVDPPLPQNNFFGR